MSATPRGKDQAAMESRTAIMICGHGSRDAEAVAEFGLLAEAVRARLPDRAVASGFLEFARPTIQDGLERLRRGGAERILALPGMLFAASHVKNDLPWEVNSFQAANPGVRVTLGRDLSIEPKLLRAAQARIERAEAEAAAAIPRAETLLLVVGRGTNDPDANSNIAKVARMLWEGIGFGWAECAFSGVAKPLVEEGLERASRLGFRRIVTFPYFLFTGVLVKRIYARVDEAAARFPGIEFLKAGYLRDHPLVIDTFLERIDEAANGTAAMNCQLCKYRERMIGYEGEVGAVQAGHHHHVRGIGTDADHAHPHSHDHGHVRDHGHDHGLGHGHDRVHGRADGRTGGM